MDILGRQFPSRNQGFDIMVAFGEHDYPESTYPYKDPGGTVLQHEHTEPRPGGPNQLEPYQQLMVSESGPRQLNSMQHLKGRV